VAKSVRARSYGGEGHQAADAIQQFESDAATQSRDGFRVVSQAWNGSTLVVTYERRGWSWRLPLLAAVLALAGAVAVYGAVQVAAPSCGPLSPNLATPDGIKAALPQSITESGRRYSVIYKVVPTPDWVEGISSGSLGLERLVESAGVGKQSMPASTVISDAVIGADDPNPFLHIAVMRIEAACEDALMSASTNWVRSLMQTTAPSFRETSTQINGYHVAMFHNDEERIMIVAAGDLFVLLDTNDRFGSAYLDALSLR
jgi:hypothetical protein